MKKNILFGLVILFSKFSHGSVDHVVIISIDGGKPASILSSEMPRLRELIQDGAGTLTAKTIVPSLTLPSHTSMLTGVGPQIHGITWNTYLPFKGIVQVPTIFSIAKDNGFTTAFFASKEKFKHLLIPNSFDMFSLVGKDSAYISAAAADYIETEKPGLIFVHLPDADIAGHSKGWGSNAQISSLKKIDKSIGEVVDAVRSSYKNRSYEIIVTADHGGTRKAHGSSSGDDRNIPWIIYGTASKKGVEISSEIITMDTAATALWLLGVPLPQNFKGRPVEEAF